MPRPFTGGAQAYRRCPRRKAQAQLSDSPSAAGSGCGAAGFAAAGAFFAPGRRAPGAMPRPLTSGSAAVEAGSVAADAGSVAVDAGSAGAAGAGLLGARPPCARGDAEALDLGLGLGRLGRSGGFGSGRCGLLGAGTLGAGGDAEPLGRRQRRGAAAARASAAGAAAFLAPGRLAPPAMPSPVTGLVSVAVAALASGSVLAPAWLPVRPARSRPSSRRAPRLPLPPCPSRAA